VDWPTHIETLTDFWAWQLLGERGYEGNPLRAHEPLHARRPLDAAHFRRWLAIFDETVDRHWSGPSAELAKHRARRMARAMHRLLHGTSARGNVELEPVLQPASMARSNMRSGDVEAH
jgi:hemoglobin